MGNRLRNLFDDNIQELSGKVSFVSSEKYNEFVEALRKVKEEGKPYFVDGISEISITAKDGESRYTIEDNKNIENVVIFPHEEIVNMDVKTDVGDRKLCFLRKELNDKYILRNVQGKGAYVEIEYNLKTKNVSVSYKADYREDVSLEEMIDYYNVLFYFSKSFFRSDKKNEELDNVLNHFLASMIFFERLNSLSKLLDVDINPKLINEINDDDLFIERAYFSLVEKKIIRSNRKVNSMNNVQLSRGKDPGNNPLIATYLETGKMRFIDKEIDVYFVNMAFNLIVEREEEIDADNAKLIFRDDENNPMFISSRIFTDEIEAKKEMEKAMEQKKLYQDAKTLMEWIRKTHNDKFTSKSSLVD